VKKLPVYFYLLAGVFVLRLFLVFLFPPTADEVYYLLWAKHLSLSYVDHPPMIAFLNFIFTKAPIDPLIASRLGCVLLSLGIAAVIYKISNSWLAALLFWLTPYALVMALVLTVEIPFILFYLLTIYFLGEWLKNQKQKDLIWAGVFTGLGFVSKYSMILILLTTFVLICLPSFKKLRTIQNFKSFLIYAGIAGFIFLPVLLSNLFAGGESFLFHLSRVGEWRGLAGLSQYFSEQILYLSPVLVIALISVMRFRNKLSAPEIFLLLSGIVPLIFFGALSFKTMVWPHWPAAAYAPLLILLVQKWEQNKRSGRYWLTALVLFNCLLLGVLLYADPGVWNHQAAYRQNKKITGQVSQLEKEIPIAQIYTDQHGTAGQLSYYLNTTVLMPTQLLSVEDSIWGKKQFAKWNPPLKKGDNVIFYVALDSKNVSGLKKYFQSVQKLDWAPLAVIEKHLQDKTFFLAKGFKLDQQKL
jgi:4-amino-4-deoxy-L-arabinose transferase-like glycosyltransferase